MIKAKKFWGQHFLGDDYVIAAIAQAINPKVGQNLIEIGPGLGALTKAILPLVHKLIAIEIDERCALALQKNYGALNQLELYQQDVLDFNFYKLAEKKPLRIIGNLPYNISSPLLIQLFDCIELIEDMHFLLQKEVAERLAAKNNSKKYGRLSVLAQYFCQVELLFSVPPSAFSPPPKVDSAVVRLRPYSNLPHIAHNYELFNELVKQAFGKRRKTLANSLKSLCQPKDFEQTQIEPTLRAENLTVAQFVQLTNQLQSTKAI